MKITTLIEYVRAVVTTGNTVELSRNQILDAVRLPPFADPSAFARLVAEEIASETGAELDEDKVRQAFVFRPAP